MLVKISDSGDDGSRFSLVYNQEVMSAEETLHMCLEAMAGYGFQKESIDLAVLSAAQEIDPR